MAECSSGRSSDWLRLHRHPVRYVEDKWFAIRRNDIDESVVAEADLARRSNNVVFFAVARKGFVIVHAVGKANGILASAGSPEVTPRLEARARRWCSTPTAGRRLSVRQFVKDVACVKPRVVGGPLDRHKSLADVRRVRGRMVQGKARGGGAEGACNEAVPATPAR